MEILKLILSVLATTLLLTACNDSKSANRADELLIKHNAVVTTEKDEQERISFSKIDQIISGAVSSIWVEKQNNEFSLALHFQYKDTLAVSYSPECWFKYPYKLEENRIIVYYDNNIDTKYDFDLVKAMFKINSEYLGKPFMILELENDTTLKVTYPEKELIRKLNNSSKKRVFFPTHFTLVQDGEMYD